MLHTHSLDNTLPKEKSQREAIVNTQETHTHIKIFQHITLLDNKSSVQTSQVCTARLTEGQRTHAGHRRMDMCMYAAGNGCEGF